MKSLFRLLHAPPTSHPFTQRKIALVSGLSDPTTCALTHEQLALLDDVAPSAECKVAWNFPFVADVRTARAKPPLWRASWSNARQFTMFPTEPYRRAARRHWDAFVGSAEEIVVVTLSCGFEIVRQLHDPQVHAGIRIVALGPVAWRRASFPHTLVLGERDWISRCFFRRADVIIPRIGHMEYVESPEVRQFLRVHAWTNASKLLERDCISRARS